MKDKDILINDLKQKIKNLESKLTIYEQSNRLKTPMSISEKSSHDIA